MNTFSIVRKSGAHKTKDFLSILMVFFGCLLFWGLVYTVAFKHATTLRLVDKQGEHSLIIERWMYGVKTEGYGDTRKTFSTFMWIEVKRETLPQSGNELRWLPVPELPCQGQEYEGCERPDRLDTYQLIFEGGQICFTDKATYLRAATGRTYRVLRNRFGLDCSLLEEVE